MSAAVAQSEGGWAAEGSWFKPQMLMLNSENILKLETEKKLEVAEAYTPKKM